MKTTSNFHPLCGLLAATCLIMAPTALAQEPQNGDKSEDQQQAQAGSLDKVSELIAVIQPASGSNVQGAVLFEEVPEGVKITAKIGGLEPDSKHGIHIHQFGNIVAEDGTSAGGHYNPTGQEHALPDEPERHAGDLGNLVAGPDGNATLTLTVDNISLIGEKAPIIGRAVIVHSKEDDGGQPTGNAGDRIGMGVIGVSKAADKSGSE